MGGFMGEMSKIKTGIKENFLEFYEQLAADENSSYWSWEYCFLHFQNLRCQHTYTEKDMEIASLHLAFYLASWGMYRGSSFLFRKDYKIHIPIIQVILGNEYSELWNIDIDTLSDNISKIQKIFTLSEKIKNKYIEVAQVVNGENRPVNPSPILITKILLGTMSCTPAYDRYFNAGVRYLKQNFKSFKMQSHVNLLQFYSENSQDFKDTQKEIYKRRKINYPIMKLIDMYFWNIGYNAEQIKKTR